MDNTKAYELLLGESFGIDLNANDFFQYATAQIVTIAESDFYWVIPHIQKWGIEGVYSVMAYVQNQKPLPAYLTPKLEESIKELMDRQQVVNADIDWRFYYYEPAGPYRDINIDL